MEPQKERLNTMTAKEYLNSLKCLNAMIRQKTEELEDLKAKSLSIKAIDYSGERVDKSRSVNAPFVKILDKIVDLSNEIAQDIEKLVMQQHKIIDQIQELKNNKYVDILYKRYVQFKKFERIALEMNYDYEYIKHLHTDALYEFERIHSFTKDNTK